MASHNVLTSSDFTAKALTSETVVTFTGKVDRREETINPGIRRVKSSCGSRRSKCKGRLSHPDAGQQDAGYPEDIRLRYWFLIFGEELHRNMCCAAGLVDRRRMTDWDLRSFRRQS